MKEFMLLIRAKGNPILNLEFKQQQAHIEKIGKFIRDLHEAGKLKSAQPFEVSGIMLESKNGELSESTYPEIKEDAKEEELIVGYYHIEVENLEEALSIARSDPRFLDSDWRIELRPIMTIEGINSEKAKS